jgi:AmmeMemoRadiSam system protein B
VDFEGVALPPDDALATPLGNIPVDPAAIAELRELSGVQVLPEAYAVEHSVEVELPFLQVVLREFTIVPLVVGRASDALIRAVVERLWGGEETGFVLSSDLSHYLDYDSARRVDRATADFIEACAATSITSTQACGYRPIRGFLIAARAHGLIARTAQLRNSGDAGGTRERVVGYGAFHFEPSTATF